MERLGLRQTIMLSFPLYVCETSPLTTKEKFKLQLFKNKKKNSVPSLVKRGLKQTHDL